MVNKPQDFLTLTGAARRARSEGYDITYHQFMKGEKNYG